MNPIIAFIKLIRLPNLLIIALSQYAIRYGIISPLLGINDIELQMEELEFFFLSLSTVMIAAAGYIINDYFDIKIDRVNRPDKIIVGKYIRRRFAMGAHIVINFLALIIAAYVAYKVNNLKLVGIQVISFGALWYYSVSFKRQVLVGNIVVAFLASLVIFVAGLYEVLLQYVNIENTTNNMLFLSEEGTTYNQVRMDIIANLKNIMVWVIGFSFFAFLSTIIREIIKDNEDYEGDKKYNSRTLSVVYGTEKAKWVAIIIAVIMIALLGYLQYIQYKAKDMLSLMYFSFALQIPLIYLVYKLKLANQKEDYTHLSRVMKVIMLAGIAYAGLFYYLA